MASTSIRLTSSNSTLSSDKSTFTMQFPTGASFADYQVALGQLYVYNSWFNVSSTYANKTFSYTWIDDVEYDVELADGIYSIRTLNEYLEFVMYSNGHYLLDNAGSPVYYLSLVLNTTNYRVTVVSTAVPETLPSGYTNESGFALPVGADKTPLLNIPANTVVSGIERGIGVLLGYDAGSYPSTAQTATVSYNGQSVPVVSPISQVQMIVNIVDNSAFSVQDNVIRVFSPNVSAGAQFALEPQSPIWYNCLPGSFQSLIVRFVDQDFIPIAINDPNGLLVELLLREKQ